MHAQYWPRTYTISTTVPLAGQGITYINIYRELLDSYRCRHVKKIVMQISLPSIRENWTGKKEMSCTFEATRLTPETRDNVFPIQIKI